VHEGDVNKENTTRDKETKIDAPINVVFSFSNNITFSLLS